MAPLRWGIASAGRISNDFCAALSTLPSEDHKIIAVAARAEESAKKFAENFQIPKFYAGNAAYEELAKDPEIDAVYIGTINPYHMNIGLIMLEGGKHVLCEKPLTLNEKQSRKLLEKAKEKKLICFEAIWSRFFPAYEHLKSRLDNGDLGQIKEVDVEFGFNLLGAARVTEKQLGGGTILDLGIYTIQFSQFVFREEPISIKATGKLNEDGVDILTNVEMKYKSGGLARFKTSALEQLSNKATINGSKGSITIPTFWCPTTLIDIDQSTKEWELPKQKLGKFEFHNSAGLRYEAEAMRKYFNAGVLESDVVSHEESLRIARIEDELRKQIGVKFPEDD